MRAKYRSLCVRCKYPILPGEEIDYAKGVGSAHTLCISPSSTEILYGNFQPGELVQLPHDRTWWVVIGPHNPGTVKARKASLEEIPADETNN